jgi:hypothetical protein
VSKLWGAERSRTIFFSSPIVRPDEPSEAAKRKIARRQSVDGTPIMAWHDLIANLGTLTINDVKLPIAEGRTLHMLASDAQVFALLAVPTPRVH